MLDKEWSDLTAEIKKVFADVPYPKKMYRVHEIWPLEGKKWQELSVEDVLSNHGFLSFSAAGFRYFLPGYMIVMLQNPEKMKGEFVTEYLLKYLTQEYPELKINFQQLNLYKTFTDKERRIIRRFLDIYEPLWIPNDEGFEARLLNLEPKLRYKVRKNFEDRRDGLQKLLQQARQFWQ